MKRLLNILILAIALALPAMAQDGPKATFEVTNHNFGTIKESKGPVTCKFEFVNTGDKPLIITDATASCGCTRPEFPTKPIKPGKKGKIRGRHESAATTLPYPHPCQPRGCFPITYMLSSCFYHQSCCRYM